ncbi:MAG: hypothetical protein QOI01_5047 [Mycobacterium sp.]|nr:hypothetical protein [Mycobacterium sp.]
MESRIVAEVGGLAVAEHGTLVLLVDRGTGPLATRAFVIGVLALVVGGYGAVALTLAATGSATLPWWIGAIFLIVGVVFGGAVIAVVSRIRDARARPLGSYRPDAVFDRARRVYLDAGGAGVARTPSGTRILKRGNPFNGGIGDLHTVLIGLLFGYPR